MAQATPAVRQTRRSYQRVLSTLAVVALTAVAVVVPPGPLAYAAPGDHTITVAAPATTPVNANFSQEVSITCLEGPCNGLVLRQQLPDELKLVSVLTGPGQVVASVAGGTDLGAELTYTLNDIATAGVLVFNVILANDDSVTTTVSPSSRWDLSVASDTVTSNVARTQPTGTIQPLVVKTESTVPGTGNREVTYAVRGRTSPNASGNARGIFAPRNLTWEDTLPAGAQVVRTVGVNGYNWTSTINPDGTTTMRLVYGVNGTPGTWGFFYPSMVVYYPPEYFPSGLRPPTNTVQLSAEARDGTIYRSSASVQGRELSDGNGESVYVAIEKTDENAGANTGNGGMENRYRIRGIVHDTSDAQLGVRNFIVSDATSTQYFEHSYLTQLEFSFSTQLSALAAPYQIQLRYSDAPETWVTVRTGRTNASVVIQPRVTGSTGVGANTVYRPDGTYITGWRIVISPAEDDVAVVSGSMVNALATYFNLWRSLADDTPPDNILANGRGRIPNTATVSAYGIEAGAQLPAAQDTRNNDIWDGIGASATIDLPATLSVGASNQRVSATLTVADDREVSACLAIVLPLGVRWDGQAPQLLESVVPNYAMNDPLNITTVTRSSVTGGRDAVTICFDKPFPPTMHGEHPTGYRSAVEVSIGVTVLPAAYDPNTASSVTGYAYGIISDPAGVPSSSFNGAILNDQFDLDPTRTQVPGQADVASVTSDGGLQLSKEVSSDAGQSWTVAGDAELGQTVQWRVEAYNNLRVDAFDVEVCDALPRVGDAHGSRFALTLVGAVQGAPGTATVEYAVAGEDACTNPSTTWTGTAAGATAFRVVVPMLAQSSSFGITYRTTLPASGLRGGDKAVNVAELSATVSAVRSQHLPSNEASIAVTPEPELSLVKLTNGERYTAAPGAEVDPDSTVTWTYVVTNTGNTVLDDVVISDDFLAGDASTGTITPTSTDAGLLAPGESRTFSASDEAILGQYYNQATVRATAVDSAGDALASQPTPASDQSWYLAEERPQLEVVKTVSAEENGSYGERAVVEPAASAWFRIVVRNTGNVDLEDVVLLDDALGERIEVGDLAVGEGRTYRLQDAAVAEGYTNVAIASALYDGEPVTDDDDAVVVAGVGVLSQTGVTSLWVIFGTGSALVMLGLGMMLMRRVRREA